MAICIYCVVSNNDNIIVILVGIREWFRWYKVPDGKPLNKFGFDEKCLSRKVAEEIVVETHHYWKELVEQSSSELVAKPSNLWTPK